MIPTFRRKKQNQMLTRATEKLKAFLAIRLECVEEEVKLRGWNKKANPIYLIWQPVWGNS
jgi:hypothetical protein